MTNITAVLILTAMMICVTLSGCASEGLKVSYEVRKEEFSGLHSPMQIRVVDTRTAKEIVDSGIKPGVGKDILGYLFLGPAYAPIQYINRNGPQVPEENQLPETIRQAFVERFSANGVTVTRAGDTTPILLEIDLTKFSLDSSWGTGLPKLATGQR